MSDRPFVIRRPFGPPPLVLRVAAVLVVPLLLYALVATGQKAVDNYRLNQDAERLRVEIVALRAENLQLQQQIEDARTDAAIETMAREQLGLVKPGDHPVVLVGEAASGAGEAAADRRAPDSSEAAANRAPWRQWWDYFLGP